MLGAQILFLHPSRGMTPHQEADGQILGRQVLLVQPGRQDAPHYNAPTHNMVESRNVGRSSRHTIKGGVTIDKRAGQHRRYFYLFIYFFRTFFTFQLLDKPWSQVSSLLPPGSCLQFISRIGFSNPTARRLFIECC